MMIKLYSLWLIIYFIGYALFEDKLSLLACFANFIPMALFPVIFTLPLAIRQHDKIMLASGLLASLFFLLEYSHQFTPNLGVSDNNFSDLRILSHNIGQDLPNYEDINALIYSSQANIVFLQEVTEDYIQHYLPNLIDIYPYQTCGPLQGKKRVGMVVLSRYPFVMVENFKLVEDGLVFQQRLLLDVNGKQIVAYNVHTTFPWINIHYPFPFNIPWPVYEDQVRRREITELFELVEKEQQPVILVGDFNFTDQSSDYKKISGVLLDAYSDAGWGLGLTWPANRTPSVNIPSFIRLVRVDYLFHSTSLHCVNAHILPKTGSDHLPMLFNLAFSIDK